MNKVQCPEGHFYDADMFSACPMCEKMENIGKSMNSKKNKFGKKAKESSDKPAQPAPAPSKVSGSARKRNAPSQGNIVTVAIFPSGSESVEKEENPGNAGILDENGRLILKAESRPVKKKIQGDDYITAAEIADANKKEETVEEEPEQEPEEIAVIIKEEDAAEEEAPAEEESSEQEEAAPEEAEAESAEPAETEPEEESAPEETEEEKAGPEESAPEEPAPEEPKQNEPINIAPNISPVIPSEYKAPGDGPKTVGFYHFDVDPVVGWLVCVSGQIKGKSFKLKSGQNVIGDSGIMDVYLPSKDKRKGEAQALLIFEPIKKEFLFRVTGAAECSVNGEKTDSYVALKNYDKICVGEYQLVFKALCSDKFDWKDYE